MIYKPKTQKRWNADLAYLFGLLLGDGSLPIAKSKRPNGKYQRRYFISFVSNSKDFLDKVYLPLFKNVLGLTPYTSVVPNKINILYNCRIESKIAYEHLKSLGYTIGRKAKIAKIPKIPKKYQIYLLAGLLDTDGGKKGNGFGLSTASEDFAIFCKKVFDKLDIPYNSCPWYYNGHTYHQIYTKKSKMWKILKSIPIKNIDKINYIRLNSSVG